MKSDATNVKAVDPGQKLPCCTAKKKQNYFNLPVRQFTDIMATISTQNVA